MTNDDRVGGFLNPELEKRLLGDIEGVSNVQLWREHVQVKEAVEYTMYFNDEHDKKRRVDFDVPMDAIYMMTNPEIEDFVSRLARAAIMEEIDNG